MKLSSGPMSALMTSRRLEGRTRPRYELTEPRQRALTQPHVSKSTPESHANLFQCVERSVTYNDGADEIGAAIVSGGNIHQLASCAPVSKEIFKRLESN